MGVVVRLDRGIDVVSRRFRAPDVLENAFDLFDPQLR